MDISSFSSYLPFKLSVSSLFKDVSFLRKYACVHAKLLQLCPTLCNPTDCSPPGNSVHGMLQVGLRVWVAMPSSRRSSWPRDQPHSCCSSCMAGRFFTTEVPGKPLKKMSLPLKLAFPLNFSFFLQTHSCKIISYRLFPYISFSRFLCPVCPSFSVFTYGWVSIF